MNSAALAFEAQQVIALRMMRVAAGGASAERELRLMVEEKGVAAAQAGFTAMMSLASGKSGEAVAGATIRGYRTRVRKNHRRLTKKA